MPAQAQHYFPKPLPSIEIEEIRLEGDAKRGNEFEILVRYKSLIDVNGTVELRIPQHTAFAGRASDARAISENRSFAREQIQTERFRIRVDESGNRLYHFSIRLPEAPAGYQRSAGRWLKIQSTEDGYDLFDPFNPGDRKPLEIGKDIQTFTGERPDRNKGNMQQMMQVQSTQNYNVSVSGKIRFWNEFEFLHRGVYSNDVVLWFRNSSDPGTWFHPVPSSEPIQGTHFDKLDEQGNFSFNFSFNGDLSGYDELIVLVNTANNAAIMPAPQDGYVSFSSSGYTAFFNESEGLQVSIDPAQTNITVNQNGEVNSQWGRVLRYSELSKEYLTELYGGNMTFTVPAIPTRIASLSGACGVFRNQWSFLNGFSQSIEIDPDCTEFTTVSHEFGHWSNYRMWTNNSKYNNAQKTLKEGFAIFFSFGTRNYGNRNFGDALLSGDDNTEEAPFQIGTFSGQGFRFTSIRAAHPVNGEPGFAAAASYLWNLYDDPVDNTFLASQYNIGDNDDIRSSGIFKSAA